MAIGGIRGSPAHRVRLNTLRSVCHSWAQCAMAALRTPGPQTPRLWQELAEDIYAKKGCTYLGFMDGCLQTSSWPLPPGRKLQKRELQPAEWEALREWLSAKLEQLRQNGGDTVIVKNFQGEELTRVVCKLLDPIQRVMDEVSGTLDIHQDLFMLVLGTKPLQLRWRCWKIMSHTGPTDLTLVRTTVKVSPKTINRKRLAILVNLRSYYRGWLQL